MACELSSGCKNNVYGKFKYCALHCLDDRVEDIDDYLIEFSNLFMKYLIKKIKSERFYSLDRNGSVLTDYTDSEFEHKNIIFNNELKERIGGISISVENIIFPKNIKINKIAIPIFIFI